MWYRVMACAESNLNPSGAGNSSGSYTDYTAYISTEGRGGKYHPTINTLGNLLPERGVMCGNVLEKFQTNTHIYICT